MINPTLSPKTIAVIIVPAFCAIVGGASWQSYRIQYRTAAPAAAPIASRRVTMAPAAPPAASGPMVWVNRDSGVFHYPGSRWYRTNEGALMPESTALGAGYHAAKNGQ